MIRLDVSHTFYSEKGYDNKQLFNLIYSYFKDLLLPNTINLNTFTFENMYESNQRIFLTFDENKELEGFDRIFYLYDIQEGVYSNTPKPPKMVEHNEKLLRQRNFKRILDISWTLTPKFNDVCGCCCCCRNIKTLLQLSSQANILLTDWLNNHKDELKGVVIMVDDCENCNDLIKMAILIAQST